MKATSTDLSTHCCTNPLCAADTWQVKRSSEGDFWHLRGEYGHFNVAATTPICPCCGGTLHSTVASVAA